MQAIILAAGESSRFWPLNKSHKSQIKVLGKSLIYWTIKGLSESGIKDIVVVSKPNSSLEKELAGEKFDAKISYVIQEKPLGTGNAVFQAKDFIKEPFFIFWPYKVTAKEIAKKILDKYNSENSQVILIGTKTNTPWDYGILKFEGEKVIEISENPKPGQEPSNIKVLGSYFLHPDFFEYYQKIKKHHPEDFVDALNLYIKDKKANFILLEKEPPSLKYPWELLGILKIMTNSEEFKHFVSPNAKIGKNVVINGNVYIGDNVIIGENTVIYGPCFIGRNSKIGANNVFRGPVNLENDIVTAAFTEIKNCLIQEGTHFHSGYFGDSIIGKNCRFGAGFVTANRRIDRGNIKSKVKDKKIDTGLTYFGTVVGNNSCFGIQSGTMPGVFIGSDCRVGPGTLVFENIEDGATLFTNFKFQKKK
jgi:bifunctional UDP-N-acetylglucosamine pyrophosphorylase/glucosamine-1-phosphate N-acetyltransferase